MKPNEYFEKEYSVYHINDVVELKDLKSLHSLIEEYAKYYHQEQVKNCSIQSVSVSYSLKDMEQIFFAGYYHPSIENSESEESLDNAFKKVIDRHNSNSR